MEGDAQSIRFAVNGALGPWLTAQQVRSGNALHAVVRSYLYGAVHDEVKMFFFVNLSDNPYVGRAPDLAAIHATMEDMRRQWLVLRKLEHFRLQALNICARDSRPHFCGFGITALEMGIHKPATPISPSPVIVSAVAVPEPPTRKSAASRRRMPYQSI